LGMQPLDIGAQLGGRAATAGANVGQSLLYGGLNAAKTMQAAQYDPTAIASMGLGSNQAFGQAVGTTAGKAYDWTKGLFSTPYPSSQDWQYNYPASADWQ